MTTIVHIASTYLRPAVAAGQLDTPGVLAYKQGMLQDSMIVKGGLVMIPILLGSVLALTVVIERALALWRIREDLPRLAGEVFHWVRRREFAKALELCAESRHPIAGLFRLAILGRSQKREKVEAAMEREGEARIRRLESGLGALLVIVGVEPMLGFLGTIIGLIQSFMAWEKAGNDITVSVLASGIYQAMITTAAGLIVAIPLYLLYHLLLGRIKAHAQRMTDYGNELLDLIMERREEVGV